MHAAGTEQQSNKPAGSPWEERLASKTFRRNLCNLQAQQQ